MHFFKTFALGAFMTATVAGAQSIETLSVSPDGKTLLVGGDNRTVYTLNAETLEVVGRRYIPQKVREIFYSADGAQVFLRDDADRLVAHDPASMEVLWSADDVDAVDYSPTSNVIAVLDQHFKDDSVRLLDPANGDQLGRIAMGKMRSSLLALSPDGKSALVLTNGQKSDSEPKEKEPKDLGKLEKADFKQRNDGYVSNVITVDFEKGEMVASETFYRISFPKQVRYAEGNMLVLRSNFDSAIVQPDGTAELIDLGEKFFNWAALDRSRETFIFANQVELRFVPVGGGAAEGLLTGERLPRGAPGEWITAMTEAEDGTLFFATNAYRLLRVPANRGSVDIVPIR